MTLTEIKAKIQSWRVNPHEEDNEHVDILTAIVDYLIDREKPGKR